MSEQKKLDAFFQSAFSDYSPEVPPQVWENIIAEKRKKRPVVFWQTKTGMLLIAACLLAGAGAWILSQTSRPPVATNEAAAGKENQTNKSTRLLPTEDNSSNTTAGAPTTAPGEMQPAQGHAQVPVIAITQQPSVNSTAARHTGTTATDPSNAALANRDATGGNNHLHTAAGRKRGSPSKLFTSARAATIGTGDDADTDPEDGMVSVNNQPTGVDLGIQLTGAYRQWIAIPQLATKTNAVTLIRALRIPCPEAERNAAGNKSYLELYAGPDYAFKKYSDTGNSALIQKRKESLSFQSAYSAGIRFTKVFANGISVRAGVNYSQINEKFTFLRDNVVQIVYVISPQGDTTDQYYVRGTRYSNTYNRYRTIDVPLVLGYELGNGRLHTNINAGVMLNIYSWQKGETLDDNYLPVSITTGKEGSATYQYKTNLGVGFVGAASVYYKLTDRLHLLGEPYFRFNLSPMNKDATSLQEKFTTLGLRLGLRVDF